MELKDLVGRHKLSGVDYMPSIMEDEFYNCGNDILLCLDGITYLMTEDGDDGWRSYVSRIEVTERDVPINPESILEMRKLLYMVCTNFLPQPEIFPWAGGGGVQVEWEFKDYHIEVDSSDEGIELFICRDDVWEDGVTLKMRDIQDCFNVVKGVMEGIK